MDLGALSFTEPITEPDISRGVGPSDVLSCA